MAADEQIITASHRPGRKVPDIIVRGMHEREILALAPAMTCDRIHWDTVEPFDITDLVRDLGPDAYTRKWSDGQHRVWVPAGTGFDVRERIREWCEAHEVEAVNMRVETNVPFRDLDAIPDGLFPELVASCVDWLFPRSYAVRRKIVTELELIDDQDVRSMMYLFISDHADRYDAGREGRNGTLNFLAFLIGKLRTWPQDAARQAYGRNVMSDRIALARAVDVIAATEQRTPTEGELAGALHTSVTDLRRREQAISTLSSLRNPHSLVAGERDAEVMDAVQVAADIDVEAEATDHDRNAQLTRAIMGAVNTPGSTGRRGHDPLALAAVYLTFWEGLGRSDVARELDVLPKTVAASIGRVLEQVQTADLL